MNTKPLDYGNAWWDRDNKAGQIERLRDAAIAQAEEHNRLHSDVGHLLKYLGLEVFDGREIRKRAEA